jgi:hypothetical protein
MCLTTMVNLVLEQMEQQSIEPFVLNAIATVHIDQAGEAIRA